MSNITNYAIDIRGASKEDVQKVATAISKIVCKDFNYQVKDSDLDNAVIAPNDPYYVGLQGVNFFGDDMITYANDQMTKDFFKSYTKCLMHGVLTVKEAIEKFNL